MRVPRSQRGGEVVEPLVRDQWFVRMEPLAKPALKVSAHNRRCLIVVVVKGFSSWLCSFLFLDWGSLDYAIDCNP